MALMEPVRGAELTAVEASCVPWIWEGLLAPGNVTLLTGLWKAGKTTLVSLLLSRRRQGGALLDRLVYTGGTAVVTEESVDLWRRRARRLDFGPQFTLYSRPFRRMPDVEQWHELVQQLVVEREQHGTDLVVFDPLMAFLPCGECDSTALRRLLPSLQGLAELDMAVLAMHHPAKDDGGPGKAARGSGVLSMFADIVLELRHAAGDADARRRRLLGFSRFPETPRHLLAELNAAGDDYQVLRDRDVDDDFSNAWATLAALLSGGPLSREEILARWPADRVAPHEATLWRWLYRGLQLGMLTRTGAGNRNEAFRYGLRSAAEGAEG